MAKAATLRKADLKPAKKATAKTAAKKKPQLKVVKPSAKTATKPKRAVANKPLKEVVKKLQPKVAMPKQAAKPVAKKEVPKQATKREFKIGDHVVYPTHGVGRIVSEETQQIGEISLRMLVIAFDKDRMTLRVPVNRAAVAGLRHISGNDRMAEVFVTLKARARSSRGMWSRRAQEYESKINSGSVISVAEVVRDLHPNVDQAERSYSERMIYESALNRLVGELAAAERMDLQTATDKLMKLLRSKMAA